MKTMKTIKKLSQLFIIALISTSCSSDDSNNSNKLNNIPQNGLLAYYPFDNNANDESTNTHNGIVNEATLTTGRNGNSNSAYNFSEPESNIDVGDVDFFSGTNTSFSISAWVKINEANSTTISIASKLSQDNSVATCNEFEERDLEISIRRLGPCSRHAVRANSKYRLRQA